MSKTLILKSTVLLAAILILASGQGESSTVFARPQLFVSQYENVLGTSLEIKVVAASAAQSEKADAAVLAEIERESHILSSWDPDSEFSRWFQTRNEPVRVSPELFEVLSLFDQWRDATSGALDASAETITRVWKRAAAEKRLPSQVELNAAIASVQRVHWRLDAANHTATHTSEAALAMNSFVKSYIAGNAAEIALNASGVRGIVVNIGGDLVVRGDWKEAVNVADPKSDAENADPIARLLVHDRTVATSGELSARRRDWRASLFAYRGSSNRYAGGTNYQFHSHSPESGGSGRVGHRIFRAGADGKRASSCFLAGCGMPSDKKNGDKITSRGWASLEATRTPLRGVVLRPATTYEKLAAQSGVSEWNPKYELVVTLELSLIDGYRVHRPYLAVWIEDEAHAPSAPSPCGSVNINISTNCGPGAGSKACGLSARTRT